VEFNDFLSKPDHLEEASKACLDALLSQDYHFDEIVVSMIVKSRADALMKNFTHVNVILESPAFKTDLKQLSSGKRHYLDSLHRNTRYQINHSRRIYESQYGTLQISFAANSKQAIQYWTEAGELHIKRWHDSGFLNPKFVSFHKAFIINNFDSGRIDLARITAGNHLIAIIYNVIYKKNVYFYLQGIQPENNGKLKPGLTAHAMLIEHYLHQGMESYDFMGGYSQYKKQLSQVSESLLIIKIQKPLLKFRLENIARNFKRKILQPDKVSP
jgi:CelD/BcsL family acetyltransferase involved in cellulose biosynthesis